MRDRKLDTIVLLFLISVSFFGLFLVVISVFNSPVAQEHFTFRKPLVGLAFSAVCVSGVFAVLSSGSCGGIIHFKKRKKNLHNSTEPNTLVLLGHHASCTHYSTHVIQASGKILCATCSGLLVGAVISLVGIGLFFFVNLPIWGDPLLLVFVGIFGVASGLLYPSVPVKAQNSYPRFFVGALLAVGSFFILVGVEKAISSLAIDFFVIVLSALWVVLKIHLSRREHRRICARCSFSLCNAKSRF